MVCASGVGSGGMSPVCTGGLGAAGVGSACTGAVGAGGSVWASSKTEVKKKIPVERPVPVSKTASRLHAIPSSCASLVPNPYI